MSTDRLPTRTIFIESPEEAERKQKQFTALRKGCVLHQLNALDDERRVIQGDIIPDSLSILRWMNDRLAHETRADGSCERHCARCQLEGDPEIVRQRERRRAAA